MLKYRNEKDCSLYYTCTKLANVLPFFMFAFLVVFLWIFYKYLSYLVHGIVWCLNRFLSDLDTFIIFILLWKMALLLLTWAPPDFGLWGRRFSLDGFFRWRILKVMVSCFCIFRKWTLRAWDLITIKNWVWYPHSIQLKNMIWSWVGSMNGECLYCFQCLWSLLADGNSCWHCLHMWTCSTVSNDSRTTSPNP